MVVHLIDGTFELFRHYFAVPKAHDSSGMEVGAVRGVLASVRGMINGGATHVGVATDHVIESFRNEREKMNLLYWQLTCYSFYTPDAWAWLYKEFGYTGDYGFIYFE